MAFALVFVCGIFAFERLAFELFIFDEFMLLIGVLGGAIVGAGVEVFRFVRFALLLALFAVPSPQPKPMAPIAKTAVIAIFFIILNCTPVFSKIRTYGRP